MDYDEQPLKNMAYVQKEILFNKNGYKRILKMRKAQNDRGAPQRHCQFNSGLADWTA
jgi:hypothetical protein